MQSANWSIPLNVSCLPTSCIKYIFPYLKAGILPKKRTKTIKEINRTTPATFVKSPIAKIQAKQYTCRDSAFRAEFLGKACSKVKQGIQEYAPNMARGKQCPSTEVK